MGSGPDQALKEKEDTRGGREPNTRGEERDSNQNRIELKGEGKRELSTISDVLHQES